MKIKPDETKKPKWIHIDSDTKMKLRIEAAKKDMILKEYIEFVLIKHVEDEKQD